MSDESKTSYTLGYNQRDSPWKFEIKIYVDGEQIKTLDEARTEAHAQLAKAMTSENLI